MAEKTLEQVNQRVRDYYQRGMAALDKGNYDFAMKFLLESLKEEPAFLRARKALRTAQIKNFQKSQQGASKLGSLFKGVIQSSATGMTSINPEKKPFEALVDAEEKMCKNPLNVSNLTYLAKAAEYCQLGEVAVQALEIAKEQNPTSVPILKELARVYNGVGYLPEKAQSIYQEILRISPLDEEAKKGLKDSSANASMKKGGWDTAESYRDVLKDESQAVSLEQEARVIKTEDVITSQISNLEKQLALTPDNLTLYRRIGDLYSQKKDFAKALEYLEAAASREMGADPTLHQQISNTKIKQLEHQIQLVKADLANQPDSAELAAKVQELQTRRDQFQIDDVKARRDRYPNDLKVRFELGQLLFKFGDVKGAMQEFQLARNHPQLAPQALNHLGQCFLRQGVAPLAIKQFQQAEALLPLMDDLKKDVLYHMAKAHEAQGEAEKAKEQYLKLYEADITYRDVAQKLGL